ncbi:hypothetical protein QTP88_019700 [Uroleucon formosanum]
MADPSNRADPESPLDRDESDSDSVSECGSSGGSVTPVPRKQPALVGRTLTAKQSVVRHIRDLHEEADSTVVRCVGCRSVLVTRPEAHKCGVEIEGAEDAVGQYDCSVAGCEMSFPTKQGLSNHLRNHRRQVIVEAAAVPLPVPATRQRLRTDPAPRSTRGGDARVPVVQAADLPRIPAGDRPPATGGAPLPPTSRAEPRITDGTRPPDTGGSVSIPTGSALRTPAGTRPPATGCAPLLRMPSMQPASMRRGTPVRPRGVSDRLSLPLLPPPPPRHESLCGSFCRGCSVSYSRPHHCNVHSNVIRWLLDLRAETINPLVPRDAFATRHLPPAYIPVWVFVLFRCVRSVSSSFVLVSATHVLSERVANPCGPTGACSRRRGLTGLTQTNRSCDSEVRNGFFFFFFFCQQPTAAVSWTSQARLESAFWSSCL